MKNSSCKHFYLFKGDWYETFIELIDLIERTQQEKFFIWEPHDRKKDYNIIIVYGKTLPAEYCLDKRIWKTDEKVFDTFYKPKINKYNIYGS